MLLYLRLAIVELFFQIKHFLSALSQFRVTLGGWASIRHNEVCTKVSDQGFEGIILAHGIVTQQQNSGNNNVAERFHSDLILSKAHLKQAFVL